MYSSDDIRLMQMHHRMKNETIFTKGTIDHSIREKMCPVAYHFTFVLIQVTDRDLLSNEWNWALNTEGNLSNLCYSSCNCHDFTITNMV